MPEKEERNERGKEKDRTPPFHSYTREKGTSLNISPFFLASTYEKKGGERGHTRIFMYCLSDDTGVDRT